MRGVFVRVREWPGSGAGAAALGAGAFTGDNMKISSKFYVIYVAQTSGTSFKSYSYRYPELIRD